LNEARERSRRQRSLDSSSGSDNDDGHDVGDSAGEMTISPLDQESRRRFLVHAGLLDTDSEASDGSEASENSNDRAFIGTYSDIIFRRSCLVNPYVYDSLSVGLQTIRSRNNKVMSPLSPSSKRRRRRPLLALQIPPAWATEFSPRTFPRIKRYCPAYSVTGLGSRLIALTRHTSA
jgi:hypothetical protein